jgi:hypothetical protein
MLKTSLTFMHRYRFTAWRIAVAAVGLCLLNACTSLGSRTVPRDSFNYKKALAQAYDNLGRLHPRAPVCPCGYRLFLGGSTDAARVGYYVLFFIHLESRHVEVAGITPHPNEAWMKQIARNVTMDEWGFSIIADISSMTVTPSTVRHFGKSSNPVVSKRCRSLHAAPI